MVKKGTKNAEGQFEVRRMELMDRRRRNRGREFKAKGSKGKAEKDEKREQGDNALSCG